MKIFIDGKFCSERDAKVSVFDHGLLYGDGVFEGIRAYNGRVFKLKEHIDRLFYSAKAILLEIPLTHAQMMKATVELIRDPADVLNLGLEIMGRYAGGEIDENGRGFVAAQAAKRVGLHFVPSETATWDHRKLGGGY